ncbi:MAG: xylulokinase [Microbacteriaceae bacterium]
MSAETVIGVDSSTQSTKVLRVDAETGTVLGSASSPHPDATAVNPAVWSAALREAWAQANAGATATSQAGPVRAVSVAAQQHGMVALDDADVPVFDALLWNDTRSAAQAQRMRETIDPAVWARTVNVVPVASFTLTKLAWLAENEPEIAHRVRRVVLPHDWLNHELTGVFSTDRSDASGTGYFSAVDNRYRQELLQQFFGAVPCLPEVIPPDGVAGTVRAGWGIDSAVLGAGAGDNAAAALGLGLTDGEIAVSIGTSGTIFGPSRNPIIDPSGAVAGFADATGQYLPLLATLNAARVLSATSSMMGCSGLDEFDRLAQAGAADADGLIFVPYLDGERTPNLPSASGTLLGLTRSAMTPENLARAAVLGVLNSLADALDALVGQGITLQRVLLIGGGAKSVALQQAAASVLGVPVEIPEPGEYVALGAAKQAAWALHSVGSTPGSATIPHWQRRLQARFEPEDAGSRDGWGEEVRGRYIQARRQVYGV